MFTIYMIMCILYGKNHKNLDTLGHNFYRKISVTALEEFSWNFDNNNADNSSLKGFC